MKPARGPITSEMGDQVKHFDVLTFRRFDVSTF